MPTTIVPDAAPTRLAPERQLVVALDIGKDVHVVYARTAAGTDVLPPTKLQTLACGFQTLTTHLDAWLTSGAYDQIILGHEPTTFIPGAYIQFLRLDGAELTDPIIDRKDDTLAGPLPLVLRRVDQPEPGRPRRREGRLGDVDGPSGGVAPRQMEQLPEHLQVLAPRQVLVERGELPRHRDRRPHLVRRRGDVVHDVVARFLHASERLVQRGRPRRVQQGRLQVGQRACDRARRAVGAVELVYLLAGDVDLQLQDRLNSIPYPETGIQWWHVLPPLVLLILTRFGIPVSTTFLVLTIFTLTGGAATAGVLGSMLVKSLLGYVVAFAAGAVLFAVISRSFEKWVFKSEVEENHGAWWSIPAVTLLICVLVYLLTQGPSLPDFEAISLPAVGVTVLVAFAVAVLTNRLNTWYVLQWLSTGFLWSQWLMQDLANIFVYLPRETVVTPDGDIQVTFSIGLLIFATLLMLTLHAIIFAIRGGEIQKIVLSKTNTVDVRSATIVDFTFGIILMYFKEISDIPMSTTWVFLGLLAGREIAISIVARLRGRREAIFDVVGDAARAGAGLVVSVAMAILLPWLGTGQLPDIRQQVFGADSPEAVESERPAPEAEDVTTGNGGGEGGGR